MNPLPANSLATLADVIAGIHIGYVTFIVLGQIAILMGWWRGWKWVRKRSFRVIHLALIAIVAVEAAAKIPCPLTIWERELRIAAGQQARTDSFVGRIVQATIFPQGLPEWVFPILHISFAGLVLLTLFLVPPVWRKTPSALPPVEA